MPVADSEDGYTLFELVFVVILVGLLMLCAVKVLEGLFHDTKKTMETNVAGLVRTGLNTYFFDPERGDKTSYPAALDHAPKGPCSPAHPCFDTVLPDGGLTTSWSKIDEKTYRSPASDTNVWTYTPADGSFEKAKL